VDGKSAEVRIKKLPNPWAVYAFEFGAWSAGTYVVRHTFSRTP
jgi:hypothetical protein